MVILAQPNHGDLQSYQPLPPMEEKPTDWWGMATLQQRLSSGELANTWQKGREDTLAINHQVSVEAKSWAT